QRVRRVGVPRRRAGVPRRLQRISAIDTCERLGVGGKLGQDLLNRREAMKIAVLGTGMVGRAIASKLVGLGHEVCMGARSATNEKAAEWVAGREKGASQGTFAEAAAFGELIFNCTSGAATLEALGLAGADNLAGKTLVDVA